MYCWRWWRIALKHQKGYFLMLLLHSILLASLTCTLHKNIDLFPSYFFTLFTFSHSSQKKKIHTHFFLLLLSHDYFSLLKCGNQGRVKKANRRTRDFDFLYSSATLPASYVSGSVVWNFFSVWNAFWLKYICTWQIFRKVSEPSLYSSFFLLGEKNH